MGSYTLSFTIFVFILVVSAFLSLFIVAPQRVPSPHGGSSVTRNT